MLHKTWDVTMGRVNAFLKGANQLPARLYSSHAPLAVLQKHPTAFTDRPRFAAIAAAHARGEFVDSALGASIGPSWATHWFYVAARVPAAMAGAHVQLRWNCSCEAALWTPDGRIVNSFTGRTDIVRRDCHTIALKATAGATVSFFIEAACNTMDGCPGTDDQCGPAPPDPDRYFTLVTAELAALDPLAWRLYHDVSTLRDLAAALPQSSQTACQALYAADSCVNAVVLSRVAETAPEGVRIAGECLQRLREQARCAGSTAHCVYAVGNCHIDTAWLWPFAETRRKTARSWVAQLRLFADPESKGQHKFAFSTAQQVAWLREDYPDLFKEIAAAVADGTFVAVGGTWVEMDCNMPSGEALCRQFLTGQAFWRSAFGRPTDIFWLPDTFGYASQLPQIMRGAGIKYFMTQKLSWNQFNKMPFNTFRWEGLDGSQVLTHFPSSDTYNGNADVAQVIASEVNHRDKERVSSSLMLYGYGDGGGGPQREMLERLSRMTEGIPGVPVVKHASPTEFFQECEKSWDKLLPWRGELYFEEHRGTYTSQAANKKSNRFCENLLRDVELWSVIANVIRGVAYPYDEIDRIWKLVLTLQFHDVLPGSAINVVYKDSAAWYADVVETSNRILAVACSRILGRVYNSLSWPRTNVVEVEDDGLLPPGVVQKSATSGRPIVVATAPALGWSVASGITTNDTSVEDCVGRYADDGKYVVLQNAYLVAKINLDGTLASLVHRATDREAIAPGTRGNRLVLFEDLPNYWDAWDCDISHLEKELPLPGAVYSVALVEAGPLRCTVRVSAKLTDACAVEQYISLTKLGRRLDFTTTVNWHEEHKFLKAEFVVNAQSLNATYETQYGEIERPTHMNTSWEMAKFEVCGHRYADLSEHGFGVSLLNDCKYGHSTRGSTMRLSLLRAPKAPDPECDMGAHVFTYALYPHAGTLQQARTLREAADLNSPLLVAKSGGGSAGSSLFAVEEVDSSCGAVVEAVKLAEDRSGDIVVRVVERFGGRGRARLVCPFGLQFARVSVANILEEVQGAVAWENNGATLQLTPYKILTIRFTLPK
eukprot:m51a1_g12075 putative alpha-mannosidase 2c1-like (1054) ;mRNA; f:671-4985